eukprot:GHVS01104356.1.p2 GENE.GHVS01104356.1~~GHVS01104356.1.p2  ORF type:complete len:100 (+),score=13.28 GHVS01104356.1:311-610(+)
MESVNADPSVWRWTKWIVVTLLIFIGGKYLGQLSEMHSLSPPTQSLCVDRFVICSLLGLLLYHTVSGGSAQSYSVFSDQRIPGDIDAEELTRQIAGGVG